MKLLFLFFLIICLGQPVCAQDYRTQWKKVEMAMEKDLPQTVVATCQQIMQQAQRRGDSAELLRATLLWISYRSAISTDSLQVDMKSLRLQADTCTNRADKCLLSLVLAVNESDAEQQAKDYRQALGIEVPGAEEVFAVLARTKTTDYTSLIKPGAASAVFGHDMLSFMRQAALPTMPYQLQRKLGKLVFERDESYYQEKGNTLAAYQVALEGVQQQAGVYRDMQALAPRYRQLPEYQLDSLMTSSSYRHEQEQVDAYQQWIAANPRHDRINQARQQLEYLKTPRLGALEVAQEVYPEQRVSFKVNAYQVQQAEVCWYLLPDATQVGWLQDLPAEKLSKMGELVKRESIILSQEWYQHTDSLVRVQAPSAVGCYRFEIRPVECGEYPVSKVKISSELVCVTRLMAITVPQNSKTVEIWAMDRATGQPVPGVTLSLFQRKNNGYQQVGEWVTNQQGWVVAEVNGHSHQLMLSKGQDATLLSPLRTSYYRASEETGVRRFHQLFTDRSIYRPGQQVSFSLLSYQMQEDNVRVTELDTIQVALRSNRLSKQVLTLDVVTDKWGTATGLIQLPADLASGTYRLQSPRAQCTIRVEEYRRPTFQLEWQPTETLYQLGDTVAIQGVATHYSGAPVRQAQVCLVTKIQQQQWWRVLAEEEIRVDTLMTDAQGGFTSFQPLRLPEYMEDAPMGTYYRFIIQALVTSQTGESHELERSVVVGRKPFALSLDYPKQTCKEKTENWMVHVYNTGFTPISQPVDIQVLRKADNQVVWQGTQISGETFEPKFVQSLPTGRYQVCLSYAGEQSVFDWDLFSLEDTNPLPDTDLWLYSPNEDMDEQHPVVLHLGTSFTEGYLVVQIFGEKGKLQTKTYTLSNQLEKLTIPYQPGFGKGLRVVSWMVHEGQVHRRDLSFKKPIPDKQLRVQWHTFRDCLQPGQQETWRLTLRHPDGTPAQVNLLAAMYDASLDALAKRSWNLNVPYLRNIPQVGALHYQRKISSYLDFPELHTYRMLYPAYDQWQDGVNLYLTTRMYANSWGIKHTRMNKQVAMMSAPAMMDTAEAAVLEEKEAVADTNAPAVRSDFRETAFFYPQLHADAQGQVSIQFTMPESLTQWRMLGLAHTVDMDYALLDKTVQVRKELMVQPHFPRFLRMGDQVDLRVGIQNLSDQEQQGTLYLELTDSTLQHVVARYQHPFQIEAGSTGSYTFAYSVARTEPTVVCRVYAKTDNYTDGEQHLLPVLSDKVWLTETKAVYLNEQQQTLDLSSMLHEGQGWNETSSMLVETIHNPLWMVLETLREQEEPRSGNAVDLAAAYYAAAMSRYLRQTYPALAIADSTSLSREAQWLKQLGQLQREDGSFAWFKGMMGSRIITRQVVELFLRLYRLTSGSLDTQPYEPMIAKAMTFLETDAIQMYESAVKWEKETRQKWMPHEAALHALYRQVLCPHSLSPMGKKAMDFFADRLSLLKGNNLYDKALACVVAAGLGQQKLANQYMQSLLEYTVCTPDLGRYFDSNLSMVSWRNYRIPTQTLLIEALDALPYPHAAQTRQELCQWLLNQRRTQQWQSSTAIMDVLYALLLSPNAQMQVTTADKMYERSEIPPATQKQMPTAWQVQRVDTTDSPMSWVSVTMQTLIPLADSQVSANHFGLHVSRIFEAGGKPAETWQVGQKVTCKIRLSVDADMDFVQLQLEKPACLEPVSTVSGYHWNTGLGYYYSPNDETVLYYMDRLPKGTYELTTDFYVTHTGSYQAGILSAQGVYCPEFSDHTGSVTLRVK